MNPSPAQTTGKKLLAEFSPVGYEDWRRLVEAELKGASFDKRMLTSTYEGITLNPLYRREDTVSLPHVNSLPGFAPFVRGTNASGYINKPWIISQEINCSDPGEFNRTARDFLGRGLNALNITLGMASGHLREPDPPNPVEAYRYRLSIATLADLEKSLEGIDLATTHLFVRSGDAILPFAALLVALSHKRNIEPSHLKGCIEADPLGLLAQHGALNQSLSGAFEEMAVLTRWAAVHAPGLKTICVNCSTWHEAGGNAVQELAYALATGIEYLREMNRRGIDVNMAAPQMRFSFTVGTHFFMEIAKLRAARLLWSRAVGVLGGDEKSQKLSMHVRTSFWNKTGYDPHNNLLRATVEAFASVLGGCDSLEVGAFDEAFRQPDDFSLRLARNTQLILLKECNLTQVIDPAGGSWSVETITAELAGRAWKLFQEIEKLGGMSVALSAGVSQAAVAATAREKINAVSRRRDSIIGVNQYADLGTELFEVTATRTKSTIQIASFLTTPQMKSYWKSSRKYGSSKARHYLRRALMPQPQGPRLAKSPAPFAVLTRPSRPSHRPVLRGRRFNLKGCELQWIITLPDIKSVLRFFFVTWVRPVNTKRGLIFLVVFLPPVATTSFRRRVSSPPRKRRRPSQIPRHGSRSSVRRTTIIPCSCRRSWRAFAAGHRTRSSFWPVFHKTRLKLTKSRA